MTPTSSQPEHDGRDGHGPFREPRGAQYTHPPHNNSVGEYVWDTTMVEIRRGNDVVTNVKEKSSPITYSLRAQLR